MKKAILTLLVPLLLLPMAAKAQWITKTEDDIFNNGKKAMLIESLSSSSSAIIFDCTKKSLSISYVEPDQETKDLDGTLAMDMIIKVDKGDAVNFDSKLTQRNDAAIAIESDDADAIKSVLKSARDAKQKVLLGIQSKDGGNQTSFSGNVSNSKNAINKFVTACEIQL